MYNNRIVVKLVTVLSLLVYACSFCSCTWFELYSSEDIYGYWKCNYQDRTLVAYVHDSVFDVFYFDNELVGAGIGSASYSTSTVSITDLSTITEFDNYEIYVG